MATQSVEFRAATGLTITAKLFSAGSDTQVASVSATEATNRKGTYTAAFTDVAAGEYQLIALDSTPTPVASWWVTLTLTTATFGVYDKSGVAVMGANTLTASALATDAVSEIQSGLATSSALTTVESKVDIIDTNVDTLLSRITSTLFSGITYLSRWLGAIAGKTADTTTRAEINATTAGAGYNETTDSQEAIRDRGDAAWTSGEGGGGSVNVAPLQATAPNRVAGAEIVTYINDTSAIGPIAITDADGDAVDLSGYTLKVCIEKISDGTILANITPSVSGTGSNQITFTPTSDCVSTTKPAAWSLRSTSNGEVLGYGPFTVESAARLS